MAKEKVQQAPKKVEPKAAEPKVAGQASKMVRYKAIARGYDGAKIREIGEIFDFAGKPGTWMKPLDEVKAAKAQASVQSGEKAPEGEVPPADKPSDSDVI